jgi:nicotinamide-nucleotide amidase
MKIEIITIGDEVMRGETLENNTVWLSVALTAVGLTPCRETSLPDEIGGIRDELSAAAGRSDAVIVTGGLGPTVDDMTRQAAIEAFGGEVEFRPDIIESIRRRFDEIGFEMPGGYLDLARIPAGAEPLENIIGAAPGLAMEQGGCMIFLLPGVPSEMKEMFDRVVLPRLAKAVDGRSRSLRKVIRVFGLMETAVEGRISPVLGDEAMKDTSIISSPSGISVYLPEGTEDEIHEGVLKSLGDDVFGTGRVRLEEVVVRMLLERGLTLAAAESLTGGMISSMIVSVPGASGTFLEGFITYSNESKVRALGVDPRSIEDHGAVSEEVCRQMAEGARCKSGADIALSATGIAGPDGGTDEKPVGLCWMGLSGAAGTNCRQRRMAGDRAMIRMRTASMCLDMLRRRMLESG